MSNRRAAIAAALLVVVLGIQLIGRERTNPAVDAAIRLEASPVPMPVTALLRRACYDCHSSETQWPWYAHVAPVSWLVTRDVDRARRKMNFSKWGRYNVYDRADLLDKVCDAVSKREMPLAPYRWLHGAAARLSDQEVAALCAWTRDEAARLTREAG